MSPDAVPVVYAVVAMFAVFIVALSVGTILTKSR